MQMQFLAISLLRGMSFSLYIIFYTEGHIKKKIVDDVKAV